MSDWTSQPPAGTGLNPIYSGGVFLWNGINPDKNEITNTSSSTGIKGASGTGVAGTYQEWLSTDGPMSWTGMTLPTTNYTLLMVVLAREASITPGDSFVNISPGSGGFRCDIHTTSGGFYAQMTNTGVANGTEINQNATFNTVPHLVVADYNGTNCVLSIADQVGVVTTTTDAMGYSSPGNGQIDLGRNIHTFGLYAMAVLSTSIGATERANLLANPWRIFAPAGGGSNTLMGQVCT